MKKTVLLLLLIASMLGAATTPQQILPTNNYTKSGLTPLMKWNSVPDETYYRLYISTTSPPPLSGYYTVGDTTIVCPASLSWNTRYYWRLRTENGMIYSDYAWYFNTGYQITTPVMVTPSNGSLNQSITPTLTWSSVSGAAAYGLQISTVTNFNSTVWGGNVAALSKTLSFGLQNSSIYYWHANSTDSATQTSSWAGTWSFNTIVASPAPPTLSMPSDGSTEQITAVAISWESVTGADSYSFQVSTVSTFSSTVNNQSGLTDISAPAGALSKSMVYYWRVNATNTGGTSAWSDIWSFETELAYPPAAPVLVAPTNNSVNQFTILPLIWNTVSGTDSYGFKVSTNSTFSSTVFNQSGITTFFKYIHVLENTAYYWQVNALNEDGAGDWSSIWKFTTGEEIFPVITSITPNHGLPSGGYKDTIHGNNFGAMGTVLWGGDTVDWDSWNQSSEDYVAFIAPAGTGTKEVILINYYDNADTTSFEYSVATPVLATPTNNSSNTDTVLTFRWHPAEGASAYSLHIAVNSGFGVEFYAGSGSLQDTFQTIPGMNKSTLYYWHVWAGNPPNGSYTAWSSIWSFTTLIEKPAFPMLISPANGITGRDTALTFTWGSVSGAASYRLQISTVNNFTTSVFNQSGITTSSKNAIGFARSKMYYWHVNATNISGTSFWSSTWNFRTGVYKSFGDISTAPKIGNKNTKIKIHATKGLGTSGLSVKFGYHPLYIYPRYNDTIATVQAYDTMRGVFNIKIKNSTPDSAIIYNGFRYGGANTNNLNTGIPIR